jgi:hypothetical protein
MPEPEIESASGLEPELDVQSQMQPDAGPEMELVMEPQPTLEPEPEPEPAPPLRLELVDLDPESPPAEQTGLLDSRDEHGHTAYRGGSGKPRVPPRQGATLTQTYITFFKSFIGIAILGLPHAFSLAGYILAPLGFFVVAYLSFYCMRLLLACKVQLLKSGEPLGLTDPAQGIGYHDVARAALGGRGQTLAEFCLVTSQGGFLVGYLIFIGANTPPALRALGGPHVSGVACVLVVSLALIPLVCLRSIKKLAGSGKKTVLLSHLYIKMIISPRQARDKHRGNSNRRPFSCSAARQPRHPLWHRCEHTHTHTHTHIHTTQTGVHVCRYVFRRPVLGQLRFTSTSARRHPI